MSNNVLQRSAASKMRKNPLLSFKGILIVCGSIFMISYVVMQKTVRSNNSVDELINYVSAEDQPSRPKQVDVLNEKDKYNVSKERNFLEIATRMGTDKVQANIRLLECLKNPSSCTRPDCKREKCRPWGHFYDTIYQSRLGPYSTDDTEPFQFLEIGYYNGRGYDTYTEFLPQAETHSMEISCIPKGKREDGKWPWGNFAEKNKKYKSLLKSERLHCGDASDVKWLNEIWTNKMKRKDSPPLKVVVDDGSHLADHMATSVFFWFPRIEPGGLMIVEDIQPIEEANKFRTQFLPQIMADMHYCGDASQKLPDDPCFPTLMPLLQSIHCEMHLCIFERNGVQASELDLDKSKMPMNALDFNKCSVFKK